MKYGMVLLNCLRLGLKAVEFAPLITLVNHLKHF